MSSTSTTYSAAAPSSTALGLWAMKRWLHNFADLSLVLYESTLTTGRASEARLVGSGASLAAFGAPAPRGRLNCQWGPCRTRCAAEQPGHGPERQGDNVSDGPADGPRNICDCPQHGEPPSSFSAERRIWLAAARPITGQVPASQPRKQSRGQRPERRRPDHGVLPSAPSVQAGMRGRAWARTSAIFRMRRVSRSGRYPTDVDEHVKGGPRRCRYFVHSSGSFLHPGRSVSRGQSVLSASGRRPGCRPLYLAAGFARAAPASSKDRGGLRVCPPPIPAPECRGRDGTRSADGQGRRAGDRPDAV